MNALLGASAGAGLAYWQATTSRPGPASSQPPSTETQRPGSVTAEAKAQSTASSRPTDPALAAEWDFAKQIESADAAELRRLWEAMGDSPYQDARDELIVQRWARLDPVGAWAVLKANPREAAQAFFAAWSQHDPAAAVASAKNEAGVHAGAAWRGLMQASLREPRRFFELAKQEPEGMKGVAFLALNERAIRGLLEYSEKETLAFAETLSGIARYRVERVLVERMAGQNLDVAMERVKTSADPKASSAGLSALLPRLMEEDWMKAGELIRDLSLADSGHDFIQDKLISGLLPHLKEHPQQVVEWIQQNLGKHEFMQWRIPLDLAIYVARSSPETALLLQAGEPFEKGNALLNAKLPGDPVESLSAAAQAPASAWRDAAADSALVQWLKNDEAAARAWAAALPEGDFKEQVNFTLAHADEGQGARLFERSLQRMEENPGNETNANVLKQAAKMLAEENPQEAWSRLLALPEGAARSLALTEIAAVSTMHMSAEETLAWAAAVPEGGDQQAIFPAIAKMLSQDDPPAVSAWLAALPAGQSRDAAAAVFAEQVREIEPEAAVAWAASVTDETRRTAALEKILPDLWKRDANMARSALEQALLSAEERAHWLSQQPPASLKP